MYETLDYYLKATENLRNSTRLLVSYIKPYRAVTSSTIGRWIKPMLGQEGIDTELFSAHSTRYASTSIATASDSTDVFLLQLVGLRSPHFVSITTSQLL